MYLPALYENILMIKNEENQQKYFFIVNKFIAEEMKNLLIEVNEFNYFAIKQLEIDVNQLIVFAEQNSPLKNPSLSLSFSPILQVNFSSFLLFIYFCYFYFIFIFIFNYLFNFNFNFNYFISFFN